MNTLLASLLITLGLISGAAASTPMEEEIQRQLHQIRSIGEQNWSQRIEEERTRKEEQEDAPRHLPRKFVLSSK